jgi:hypothetical protein
MEKLKLFIIGIFWGMLSVWGVIPLGIKFFFLLKIYPPDVFIFSLPIFFCLVMICYFIYKKRGWIIPIIGLALGYIIGIILLALGLGLGNA